jgi:hypothetical protein
LQAIADGGLTVAEWVHRWGLPAWCAEQAGVLVREHALRPDLHFPALPLLFPARTKTPPFRFEIAWSAEWDWEEQDPRREGVARIREAFEAALGTYLRERETEAAELAPFRTEAVGWLVRRVVPEVAGGEPDSLQGLADEAGLDESVISEETTALATFLEGLGRKLGRKPGRRVSPGKRAFREALERYRPR